MSRQLHITFLITLLTSCICHAQGNFDSQVASGNWNIAGSWILISGSDGDGIPDADDNVTILAGDQINLTQNEACNNLTINASGTLANSNHQLTINNNYTKNGDHTGTGLVNFDGSGGTISGSGPMTLSGTNKVRVGSYSIAAGTSMFCYGGLQFTGAYTVTNNGSIGFAKDVSSTNASASWVNAANATLSVQAALLTTGVLTASASGNTVRYSGSGAQTIKVPTSSTYAILKLHTGGTKTLGGSVNITETIEIDKATFATGGNTCTLISNASGTARIAAITGGGSISGNITVQRYIHNDSNKGWRYLAMPLTNGDLGDWDDDLVITGVSDGTDGFNGYWANTYWYDEDHADPLIGDGWTAVTTLATGLTNTQGYTVWIYDADIASGPITLDATGTVKTGNATFTITYDNNGTPAADGWNLVGNPYPSSIDWEHADVSYNASVNDAFYIWSDKDENYKGWVSGVGQNGGTQYIAQGQAFWVQTDGAAPTLTMTENVKSSNNTAFYSKTSQTPFEAIRLRIADDVSTDEAVIYFRTEATAAFDGSYDAWKLWSTEYGHANISSVTVNNEDLAINGLPGVTDGLSIPVRIKAGVTQTYNLSVGEMTVSEDYCIVLEDLQTGDFIDLRTMDSHPVTITDTDTVIRFMVHINAAVAVSASTTNLSCNGTANGMAIATAPGGPWTYQWKDENDSILRTSAMVMADTLDNLPAGNYTVYALGGGGYSCALSSTAVTLSEPQVLALSSDVTNVSCFGLANGAAGVATTGGTAPYGYTWSNGEITENISGLPASVFGLTVTDANGCTSATSITITEPGLLEASTSSADPSCEGMGDGQAAVNHSGGTAPFTYNWDNGQTDKIATDLQAGSYDVTVTDNNGCAATESVVINPGHPVNAGFTADKDTVYLYENGLVQFTNNSSGALTYRWDFGDGSPIEVTENPTHTYVNEGVFSVQLVANYGNCADTSYSNIIVDNSITTGINEIKGRITIATGNGNITVNLSLDESQQVTVTAFNLIGQQVAPTYSATGKDIIARLTVKGKGIYMLQISMEDNSFIRKVNVNK